MEDKLYLEFNDGKVKTIELKESGKVNKDDFTSLNVNEIIKVVVPVNVRVIGGEVFCNFINLEEIVLPEGLEKIFYSAFENCSKLKIVNIPKSTKYIGSQAFKDCKSLESLNILSNNDICIGDRAFENSGLKEFSVMNLKGDLENDIFYGCSNLETLRLGSGVEFFCFEHVLWNSRNNNLKHLVVPVGIKDKYEHSFSYKETIFGNWVAQFLNHIGEYGRLNSKCSITLTYENIDILHDELNKFVKKVSEFRIYDKRNFQKNFILKINGPEIDRKKMKEIKKIFQRTLIKNIVFETEKLFGEEKKFKIEMKNLDEENQNLVNQINELLNNLSGDIKNNLSNKINSLIEQYWVDVEKERPNLNEEELSGLVFESNEIGNAQIKLHTALTNIVYSLSNQVKLLELLSELDEYKKILKSNVDKKPEKKDILDDILKNILYFASKVDDNYKKEILDKVADYLNEPQKLYEKELERVFNPTAIELRIEEQFDPKKKLHLNLSNYLDKVEVESEKIIPYVELLNCLKYDDTAISFKDDDTIVGLIRNISYVVSQFSNEEEKNKIKLEFDTIINECAKEIEKIILNKSCSNEHYREFEIEIRKKLQPFLKNINQYSVKEVNQKNLLESLSISLKILNKEEDLEYKESVVTLFIKDILNIMNENNLNVEEHSNYIMRLKVLIQECLSNLDNIVDKEEISKIENKLYNDLAGIRMQVINYIKKKNRFNRTYHNYEEDGKKNKR